MGISPARCALRTFLFYGGIALALIGMTFLAMSYRDIGDINDDTGPLSYYTYNVFVEAYKYRSLNFTARANISIILTINAQFAPGAGGPEIYGREEGCIDALVMDQDNYGKWLRNESMSTLFTIGGAHSYSNIFQMYRAGTYYLVLSNAGKCTEKLVAVEIKETNAQVLGGQQYQVAGLSSLSVGAVLAIYGFTNEKVPAVKIGEKANEVDESQGNGNTS